MHRDNRLVRLFRALTDLKQHELADDLGIARATLTQYEGGKIPPSPDHLDQMARKAGITIAEGEELLLLYDTLSRSRQRAGRDPEDLFAQLGDPLRTRAHRAFQRLLRLRLPETPPRPEDRIPARELFANLKKLTPDQRIAVVRIAGEYQTWAVCELAVEEAGRGDAEAWAELAVEISEYVAGPKEWRDRVRGYALSAKARALREAGRAGEAEEATREAWKVGGEPVKTLTTEELKRELGLVTARRHQRTILP